VLKEHLTLANHIFLEKGNIEVLLEALKKIQKYQDSVKKDLK